MADLARHAVPANVSTNGEVLETPAPPAPPPPFYRRPRVVGIGAIVLVALAIIGVRYWLFARSHESTDNAFIEARVVQISPKIAGYVQDVAVTDNERVKAGAVLVQLDARDYAAMVEQARARLRAAEVAATTAAEDARRAEALFSRGLIARQDLDHAQAQARSTAAQQDAAKQALAEAELRVAYTTLRAPEAGRVTRKTVEEGQFVQPGQALLALVTDDLWVVANFKETQLADIRPGLAVQIKVDAYPRKVFRGHVDSIQAGTGSRFSLLPPENATGNYVKVVQRVPVKIVFDEPPDPERPLGPGMSVVPTVIVR
jgi:membrane fusion protein (multidrug efflux system)